MAPSKIHAKMQGKMHANALLIWERKNCRSPPDFFLKTLKKVGYFFGKSPHDHDVYVCDVCCDVAEGEIGDVSLLLLHQGEGVQDAAGGVGLEMASRFLKS